MCYRLHLSGVTMVEPYQTVSLAVRRIRELEERAVEAFLSDNFADAEHKLVEILDAASRMLNPNRLDVVIALHHLALLQERREERGDALKLRQKAHEILVRLDPFS